MNIEFVNNRRFLLRSSQFFLSFFCLRCVCSTTIQPTHNLINLIICISWTLVDRSKYANMQKNVVFIEIQMELNINTHTHNINAEWKSKIFAFIALNQSNRWCNHNEVIWLGQYTFFSLITLFHIYFSFNRRTMEWWTKLNSCIAQYDVDTKTPNTVFNIGTQCCVGAVTTANRHICVRLYYVRKQIRTKANERVMISLICSFIPTDRTR